MNHVTLVDVMLFVGDRRRGCKLDTAAKKYLGFQKYEDDAVSYDNLCATWYHGDKAKLAAYAMIDALLTKDLILVKKLNGFHLALGAIIGLPERELYLDESVRRLISIADRLGYYENMITPDTRLIRDETFPWIPDCPWVTEKHYIHLRPCGGVTVPDVSGIYFTPCATCDFSSQYPSIMIGYNICMTSLIDREDIQRLGLTKDQYTKVTLQNVRYTSMHASNMESTAMCWMEREILENARWIPSMSLYSTMHFLSRSGTLQVY
jgi:DNA polymerase delta subunit 1